MPILKNNVAIFLAAAALVFVFLIFEVFDGRRSDSGISDFSPSGAEKTAAGEPGNEETVPARGGNPPCVRDERTAKARGASLSPIVLPGDDLTLLVGYYDCREPERGDIAAYDYAGNFNPIIKLIKAVPGDAWRLKEEGESAFILVNGEILKNSEGRPYRFPLSKTAVLKLYAGDYPVIPPNTYLLLGNDVSGTLDSTRFGLADRKDLIGKVEILR